MQHLDLTGAVLDGRYRVIEPIAEGAMGVVYRAERIKLGRIVAVKILHDSLPNELSSRKRFEIEAMAMAKLEHPHCVAVLDVGLHDDHPFVVMDFVSGQDLRQVIAQSAPLPVPRAVELVRQLLSGLAHAHEHGIIHRDIKPANIVLSQKAGLGDHVKILDFGLARLSQDSSLTSGIVVGTPSYMAPEQIRGTLIDSRVDLYATGIVLFELLTGHKPFTSPKDDPIEVCSMHLKLPVPRMSDILPGQDFGELEAVVARALAKVADDRFATAAEFVAALDAVQPRRQLSTPAAGLPIAPRVATPSAGVPVREPSGPALAPPASALSWSVPSGALESISGASNAPEPSAPSFGDESSLAISTEVSGPPGARALSPASVSGPSPVVPAQSPTSVLGPLWAPEQSPASASGPSPVVSAQSPASASGPSPVVSAQSPASASGPPLAAPAQLPTSAGARPAAASVPPPAAGAPAASQPVHSVSSSAILHEEAIAPPVLDASSIDTVETPPPSSPSRASSVRRAYPDLAIPRTARRPTTTPPRAFSRPMIGIAAGAALVVIVILVTLGARGGSTTQPAADAAAAIQPSPDQPDPAAAAVSRANELAANGRQTAALELLLASRKLHPNDARLSYLAGKLYFERFWWSDGLKQLRDTVRLDPSYRLDPELLRTVLRGFNTTPRYNDELASFLRDELGATAKAALEETARDHHNATVRARAANELKRYR